MIQPTAFAQRQTTVSFEKGVWVGRFFAMGCPCEVLVELLDRKMAEAAIRLARNEAWRIEQKWSRYLKDSVVEKINRSAGAALEVDAETASLLDYCAVLYELSDAAFDPTSGVLREIWNFDGSDRIPSDSEVLRVMQRVGWQRIVCE